MITDLLTSLMITLITILLLVEVHISSSFTLPGEYVLNVMILIATFGRTQRD